MAAVRKDIRPEATFTFRSPTLNKHNHCSPQRHTILRGTTGVTVTIQPQQILRLSRKKTHILVRITYETSFTVRRATGVTIQPHQMLRLSRRKPHMLNPHHISNLIYNARSNRCHPPTWPNTAPTTKSDTHSSSSWHMKPHLQCAEQQVSWSNLTKCCACHAERLTCLILITYQTSFTMRGATGVTLQPHQMLRLPRKMTLQDVKENLQKQVKRHFQCGADPTMIRAWSEHDPRMIREWSEHENANRNPPRKLGYFARSPEAFSIVKYNVLHPILHSNFHQILRLPRKVPLERHQVLRLPRKVTLELHQVLRLPRKVTLELHQVLRLPRKITRLLYRPHIWNVISGATGVTIQPPQILRLPRKMTLQDVKENLQKQVKRHFQCGADPSMIRAWSENDPRMIRAWKRKPQPASQVMLLCEVPRSIFYCKIQRFAPNLTLKLSPNTAPATKSATWTSPSTAPATKSDTWTSPSTAPATKSDTWTSPSTAPATKNNSTAVSSSHMKRHFQCAEQQVSLTNLPKYCTCHEKWHCKMSKKISKNRWNVISNAGPIRPWSEHDPRMIREWSEHENANRNPPRKWGYFARSREAFSIVKYNVLHPILHSNFHQILRLPRKVPLERHQVLRLPRKWHLNFTKYCACHEKWHLNFTKYCACHEK